MVQLLRLPRKSFPAPVRLVRSDSGQYLPRWPPPPSSSSSSPPLDFPRTNVDVGEDTGAGAGEVAEAETEVVVVELGSGPDTGVDYGYYYSEDAAGVATSLQKG